MAEDEHEDAGSSNGNGEVLGDALNALDDMPLTDHLLTIDRVSVHGRLTADVGYVGQIPAVEGWREVVRSRVGGGVYRATGRDSKGRSRTVSVTIPGESLPLAEPEEEPAEPRFGPAYGAPGWPSYYPQPQLPGMPGMQGMPGAHPMPWMLPQDSAELNRVRQELADAKALHRQEVAELRVALREREAEVGRLQREVSKAERQAEVAAVERRHAEALGNLRAELGGGKGDRGSERTMMEWLKLQQAERQAASEVERERIRAERQTQEKLLERAYSQRSEGDPMRNFFRMFKMAQDLAQGRDPEEEESGGFGEVALKRAFGLAEEFMRQRGERAPPPPGLPQAAPQLPAPAPQPAQAAAADTPETSLEILAGVLRAVREQVQAGQDPVRFAPRCKAWLEGEGQGQIVRMLVEQRAIGVADLAAKLEQAQAFAPEAVRPELEQFVALVNDETGRAWLEAFLGAL